MNPSQRLCETQLTTDGLHCGACGNQCPVGAKCVDSECGSAATRLASLSSSGQSSSSQIKLALDSNQLYWGEQSNGVIFSIPTAGGTSQQVVMDSACGAFAVRGGNLFYWSNGTSFSGPGPAVNGLTQLSLADGTKTVLATSSDMMNGSCWSIASDAKNVYWEETTQPQGQQGQNGSSSTAALYAVPIGGGGSMTTVGSLQGNSIGTFAVNSSSLIAEFSNNGPWQFEVLPLDGSAPRQIQVNAATQGVNGFTVDDENIYVVGSGCGCCSCSGGDQSHLGGRPPAGAVAKIPLNGGRQTILAQFSGEAGSIVVESNDVYWSTDTAVWKVPLGGGQAVPLSGNLTGGTEPFLCCGNGQSNGTGAPTSIAVGGASVYVADMNSAVNALLEVSNP